MKAQYILIFTLLLAMYNTASASDPEEFKGWELAKSDEGVKVYTRKDPETGGRQVKAVTTVSASPQEAARLVKNSNAAPNWIHRMEAFETLEEKSDSVWYTWGKLNIPWPISDKDVVSKNTLKQLPDDNGLSIELESKPEYIPEKDGLNRIKNSEGQWRFISQPDGQTQIIYQVFASSESILPQFLVERVVIGSVHKTLGNMKDRLNR